MRLRRSFFLSLFIFSNFVTFAQIRFPRVEEKTNELQINYSSPKEYEIADIQVEGVEFLDKNALISLSGLSIGDKIKIPGEPITNAVKNLWRQGIIGNVSVEVTKVENGKVYLTLLLIERPRLTKFEISGLNQTHEKEILEKIDLIRGRVVTDAIVKNAELTIKKYLYEKGYLGTTVAISQRADTVLRNSIYLDISIDKGFKTKIEKIYIEGNDAFSDNRLKKKLKSTNEHIRFRLPRTIFYEALNIFRPKKIRNFLDSSVVYTKEDLKEFLSGQIKLNFFKTAKFVDDKYKEDKDLLIDFYKSKGYRDVEIISDSVYRFNDKKMNVSLTINEGQKYYFRNVIWSGNYIYTNDQLDRVLGVKKGDVYDLELINKKLNYNPSGSDVSSLYMDFGYLFFSVRPVEVEVSEDSIDVEMRIFEGAQATINKIIISGNTRTSDHVILRELRTVPGEKFSRANIIRTQRELSQLGYFDPEKVVPTPLPNPIDETVDIEWALEERPSDQIELSGGFGGQLGFIGTLGLVFNNFSVKNIPRFNKWKPLPMGDGQKLSVRMQANGPRFQSYSASFVEPWLGGSKPNSFGISYSYSVQRIIDFFSNQTNGSLKVANITLSLGRRLKWPDDFFTISNSVSFLQYRLFNFGTSLGFSDGTANNITFNTTISRNSIDSPMFPRSGSSITLSASLTPPYSLFNNIDYESAENAEKFKLVEYHKWMFDARYHISLFGNLVLQSRAHMGFIGSYSKKAGVGPFERFWLGGDGISGQNFLIGNDVIGLRGYENNSLVPTDAETGIRGGTVYNKFVFELRYPVSLNPTATIYVLGFAEGGNNWSDINLFNPFRINKSAGFGARIFMPAFGLLGIDWGYGFDELPGTTGPSGGQLHFSIGQLLR
ncbi:MAG: BamA/TamA family outer membrane protein [Bacteroidetes bacterium]|nr:BamA/TamA family outer membrane protein [Bacteroidota bacterium]MDA1119256.1 BamA/TamA family outer membrane protein [Bacteroidota bacterium]